MYNNIIKSNTVQEEHCEINNNKNK